MDDKLNRRQFSGRVSALAATAATLGIAGCMGIGSGMDGEVNIEVEGVEVTSTEIQEKEEFGIEYISLYAVIENTSSETVDIRPVGQFFDENGAELDTSSARCSEIGPGETVNKSVMSTERADSAARYELLIRENQGTLGCM